MASDLSVYDLDVVIIGAGVSGLSAAYQLWQRDPNLRVAVLEAKERIGGRTCGKQLTVANGKEVWDVGGQWVGSCQPQVMQQLQELGLETYRQYTEGKTLMQLGGNAIKGYTGDIPSLPWYSLVDLHLFIRRLQKMAQNVSVETPLQCPNATEWDSVTLEQFLRQCLWTKAAREAVEAAGRTIFGVEPAHMSLLYYLTYMKAAGGFEAVISAQEKIGGQELKVQGGAWRICHRLLDRIGKDKVFLGTPVISIEQTQEKVIVSTAQGSIFNCDRVILSLPPHQAAKIEYSPPLPVEKLHVLQRMPVGYLTKVVITYQKAFWRDKGLSGAVVTNGGPSIVGSIDRGPLCIFYDGTSFDENPALVGFIGGQQQIDYSALKAETRKKAVLHSLAQFFGTGVDNYLEYCEKNWNDEPYNGGCPVSVATPGVMTQISPGLRLPFKRLHFAGTESATVWCGFLNGAIQSGYRAAFEVLYNLRPQTVSAEDLKGSAYDTTLQAAARQQPVKLRTKHRVMRWTIGLGLACLAVVVARKAYFRMAL